LVEAPDEPPLLEELPLLLLPLDPDEDPEFLGDEYRSAYQPPPFKMNPPPSEICRLAVARLHLGHFLRGSSFIDWVASHSCSQDVQMYSYVGIGDSWAAQPQWPGGCLLGNPCGIVKLCSGRSSNGGEQTEVRAASRGSISLA